MRLRYRIAPLLLLALGVAPRADADFINFTALSISLSANGVLQIADLTFTAIPTGSPFDPASPQVGSVAGVGLGLSTLARFGSVDRRLAFDGSSSFNEGSLDIVVDGHINSITLQPYFEVVGGPPPAANQIIELSIGVGPFANFAQGGTFISPFTPHTENYPTNGGGVSHVRIGLFADQGPLPWLFDYINTNGTPGAFAWGFSVTSIDYTPSRGTSVPEPATLSLLGAALAMSWRVRRR